MVRATRCLAVLVGIFIGCSGANANTFIALGGNFIFDDDVTFFAYQADIIGLATIDTTLFVAGGFAPILGIHSSTGAFPFFSVGDLAANACGVAGHDLVGGFCYDSKLTWTSAGRSTYYVALSQAEKFPIANIPLDPPPETWNNVNVFTDPSGPGCGLSGSCLSR